MKATGVLKGRHRRALDSTVLDDAVATQDTVTQLIAALRAVIREVPGAAEAAAVQCTAHDYATPGKPRIAWHDEEARADLVDALVTDALRLLGHLPEQEPDEKAANAVGLLALVAGQDVAPAEDSGGRDGRWRITRGTAQGRMVSTVDPESRHVHKTRTHRQDGYKAHLAVEPETGVYTAVALAPGAGPEHHEAAVGLGLLADEHEPVDAFGDTAYSTGDARQALGQAGHRLFLRPAPLRAAVPGGFTLDDFTIDTTVATVTCPAGHTVPLSASGGQHQQRKAAFTDLCTGCPLRRRCAQAKAGRILTIRPHHDLLTAARRRAAADAGWRLWHPFDPTRAQAALEDLQRVRPRTVVWSNEAQHYLGDTRVGEQIAAAVHHLLTDPDRAPVLILGTLWPEYANRYTALPAPGQPDPHSRVRELLAGRTLTIPDAFTPEAPWAVTPSPAPTPMGGWPRTWPAHPNCCAATSTAPRRPGRCWRRPWTPAASGWACTCPRRS